MEVRRDDLRTVRWNDAAVAEISDGQALLHVDQFAGYVISLT